MSEAQPIRISIWALLGWVIMVALFVGGLGLYPTKYWSGNDGLHAMAWAMAVVMTAMLVSGLLIARAAKDGAAAAAMMFVMVSMIRIGVCMALTVVGWWLLALPLSPLLIWMFVLYIAMLFTEVGWLTRALHRGAILEALSRLGRRNRMQAGEKDVKGDKGAGAS
jgi:hypothetical protein